MMDLREMLGKARSELAVVTGLKPETVIQAFKNDHSWHIRVQMLEMTRIPTSTDVLGDYEAVLNEDGAMLSFERKRARLRGDPMEEQPA